MKSAALQRPGHMRFHAKLGEGNGCGGVETAQPAADLQTSVLAIQGTPRGPRNEQEATGGRLANKLVPATFRVRKLLKVERFFASRGPTFRVGD